MALGQSIGVGKGTVSFEDFEHTEAIFVLGQNPDTNHPLEMLSNQDRATSTVYFRPNLGGDMALVRGVVKYLWQWEREAQATQQPRLFDHAFITEHTHGIGPGPGLVEATLWQQIESQSELSRNEIEQAARLHADADAERVIICLAMGITQHQHSVATIQKITNLALLRGKPGAGLCPVRRSQQCARRPHHGHQ